MYAVPVDDEGPRFESTPLKTGAEITLADVVRLIQLKEYASANVALVRYARTALEKGLRERDIEVHRRLANDPGVGEQPWNDIKISLRWDSMQRPDQIEQTFRRFLVCVLDTLGACTQVTLIEPLMTN